MLSIKNNEQITENESNIYRLYKLVFKNKYLSNYIYRIIKDIGKQIVYSNMVYQKNISERYKLSSVPFEWIIKNQKYELLKYRIENKLKFENIKRKPVLIETPSNSTPIPTFTYMELKQFLQHPDTTNDMIYLFYHTNSEELLKLQYQHQETTFNNVNLISLSVYCQSFEFLKVIHQHLKINNQIQDQITDDGSSLLNLALKFGNFNIVKYLNEIVQCKLSSQSKLKSLHFSIMSENRNEILVYLLDEMDYIPPSIYSGVFDGFFCNLMKLDFKLLKRLCENTESPLLYCMPNFKQSQISFIKEQTKLTTKQFISHIQSTFYIMAIVYDNPRNNLYLKRIKHLMDYNDCISSNGELKSLIKNYHKKSYTIESSDVIKVNSINQGYCRVKDAKGPEYYLNRVVKAFKFKEIVYENFDLKREVFRLYLEFGKMTFGQLEYYAQATTEFSTEYNEYSQLKEFEKGDSEIWLFIALKHANSKLFEYGMNHLFSDIHKKNLIGRARIGLFHDISQITLFQRANDSIQLESQIQFIKLYIQYGVYLVDPHLLILYFLKLNGSIEVANKLGETLSQISNISGTIEIYHLLKWNSQSNELLNIFKHYHDSNYRHLFNWNNNEISKLAIKSGNIDLVSYIHNSKIGSLVKNSIDECTDLTTAKFMFETGCYHFSGDLSNISKLNQFNSGYLIYYTLNILTSGDKHKIIITIQKAKLCVDYKLLKYIESLLQTGQLTNDELIITNENGIKISNTEKTDIFTIMLYNVNRVCLTNNLQIIKLFFNNYQNSNDKSKYSLIAKDYSKHFILKCKKGEFYISLCENNNNKTLNF